MQLVQQGDRQAFGALFERYQTPIWGYLVRKTGDRELSSELYQEVFLRVWKSSHTFREGQPFKPWIYRVATNLSRDRFRQATREVDTVELDTERAGKPLDPISGVDLERAIAGLSDTLREAFVLGAIHGLDHNEVADALDISPANARARISRARVHLRAFLADQGVTE